MLHNCGPRHGAHCDVFGFVYCLDFEHVGHNSFALHPFCVLLYKVTRDNAPRQADRLFNLIQLGYYNDQRFFRVNGKVIQFGVHALTAMNREIYSESCTYPGACFIGDLNKISNTRGTLSFAANAREDFCKENGSTDVCHSADKGGLVVTNEIFINTIDNPAYDTTAGTGFAPVGKVVEGMAGMYYKRYYDFCTFDSLTFQHNQISLLLLLSSLIANTL